MCVSVGAGSRKKKTKVYFALFDAPNCKYKSTCKNKEKHRKTAKKRRKMARGFDHLFKLLIIGDSGEFPRHSRFPQTRCLKIASS